VRRVALPLALLVAGALAGCGTADDRDQARAATERFLEAVRSGDGAAACRELAEPLGEQLERDEGKDCSQAVTELDLEGGEVIGVEVAVTNAKVDLSSRETAFLSRGPSGWKLSAIGCAHGSRPADHPYTCEAEA
jgi:hypothetical protein